MERRLVIAFIICALLIITPFIVKLIEGQVIKYVSIPSTSVVLPQGGAVVSSGGVSYMGCGESHSGADYLIVCPIKAYVSKVGAEVRINVTVKFKHAQPCPYSNWEILIEDVRGAEVVSESRTTLVNAYTATKYFIVKVLGNGSVDVVYKYGSGCPYGTEERVHVELYVVKSLPQLEVTQTTTSQATSVTSEEVIKGTLEEVSLSGKYVVVNHTKIFIKGSWTCNGVEMKWRYLLNELSELPKGSELSVKVVKEEGSLVAIEIAFDDKVCSKGGE